jgi:hypothetical protein
MVAEVVEVRRHHTAKYLTWKMSETPRDCCPRRTLDADGSGTQRPLSTHHGQSDTIRSQALGASVGSSRTAVR